MYAQGTLEIDRHNDLLLFNKIRAEDVPINIVSFFSYRYENIDAETTSKTVITIHAIAAKIFRSEKSSIF